MQGGEAVRDELQALGLTLESDVEFGGDGKFLDVGCTAPRDIGQRTFPLAASDIEGFCRVVKHISTVPPSFVTAATGAVGEEFAAFGVAIASAFPKGFTVTQDGAEKAAHTVECADEAVFLAMTLALRRALQERQQAQQPEPEPAAGAQIISFAAEQARRQGEDETF